MDPPHVVWGIRKGAAPLCVPCKPRGCNPCSPAVPPWRDRACVVRPASILTYRLEVAVGRLDIRLIPPAEFKVGAERPWRPPIDAVGQLTTSTRRREQLEQTAVVAQLHNVHGRVGKRELMGPRGRGGRRLVVAACLAAHLDLLSDQAARDASGAAGLPELALECNHKWQDARDRGVTLVSVHHGGCRETRVAWGGFRKCGPPERWVSVRRD